MINNLLSQLNFLEAIGALTLIFGSLYFLLTSSEKRKREIDFYKFILEKDSEAHEEFKDYCKENKVSGNSALRDFFTYDKLKEINDRWEEKEGHPLR